MSKIMRNYLVGLSLAIIIYAVVVFWFIKRDILLPAELLDTIILFILASATIFYAMRTSDIAEATKEQAKATKEQADASVKMAEEMRVQRKAAKPILVPDIDLGRESFDSVMKKIAQGDFPVVITNVGTQAAIGIKIIIKGPQENIGNTYDLPLLLPGASWRSNFAYIEEFNESGDPIFGLSPSEGLYELMVTFRPAVSENVLLSEVSLPFELHWSGKGYYYDIKRSGLNIRLQE